jgi:hypothetical protein
MSFYIQDFTIIQLIRHNDTDNLLYKLLPVSDISSNEIPQHGVWSFISSQALNVKIWHRIAPRLPG